MMVWCVSQDSPEELTYEQVHSLKYLDQVFCETLRLFPPAVNFVSREAAQDIKVNFIQTDDVRSTLFLTF